MLKVVSKKTNIPLTFEKIDDLFYSKLLTYLFKDRDLQSGGANGYIKNLKVFLNWCTEKGYNKNLAYKKFKVPSNEPEIFPLNESEIKILSKAKLSGPREKARDIFLFQVYTGLRFSDVHNLRKAQIQSNSIRLQTQKTKDKLFIPLTAYSKALIEKHKNSDPEFVLPQLSNQKANKYLKLVAKECELNREIIYHEQRGKVTKTMKAELHEKITTHDGRRTFITHCLTKGMSAQMIMKITGHKNYKTFERYVKFSEKDIANQLNSVWK